MRKDPPLCSTPPYFDSPTPCLNSSKMTDKFDPPIIVLWTFLNHMRIQTEFKLFCSYLKQTLFTLKK